MSVKMALAIVAVLIVIVMLYMYWSDSSTVVAPVAAGGVVAAAKPKKKAAKKAAAPKTAVPKPAATASTGTVVVPGPVLFDTKGYAGASYPLVVGKNVLTGKPIYAKASSVQIPAGYSVALYNDAACSGKPKSYTQSVKNLDGTGYNNKVQCVMVTKQ